MKETYTKLMAQQAPSPEADAAFFEKLNHFNISTKYKPLWKAAVAAACILLLIPVTVWAAENIFGATDVAICQRPTPISGVAGIGLDIQYENIENYAVKDFSKHIQKLEESEEVLHENLAEAEEYLGIDLVDNQVLSAADTRQVAAFKERGKQFKTYCCIWEDHLLFADVQSFYHRNDVRFQLTATVTADHPTVDEAEYHNTNITYFDEHNREVLTEQYMTQAGIPVLIVTVMEDAYRWDDHDNRAILDCFACFAVDNVSYKLEPKSWEFDDDDLDKYVDMDEKVIATLKEVLEGFVIE